MSESMFWVIVKLDNGFWGIVWWIRIQSFIVNWGLRLPQLQEGNKYLF